MREREKQSNLASLIEWGSTTSAKPGESESGDRYLVKDIRHGFLVGAVDGLGHGDEAADAAKRAIATLEAYSNESVISLMQRCHEHLRRTRGAVMSLAVLNTIDETLTWLGVGNVEGILLRADPDVNPQKENILLRGGVVGYQLPPLRASMFTISKGDILVFATDGIQDKFIEGLDKKADPQRIADTICTRYKKATDDALVLVVRYRGLTV